MNGEQLARWIEIIANIAVIVSILFLVAQARLGIRMLKDAAERNHMDKHQSISRMMAENPQLAELWVRGMKSGIGALSDAERAQFVNFYTYLLRIWEELFLQKNRGAIDSRLWKSSVRILNDTRVTCGARDCWAIRRHLFTDAFQRFYETQSDDDAKPLYDAGPAE